MRLLYLAAVGVTLSLAQPVVFDVVSIKPNQTGSDSRRAGASPGGLFNATNVPLKLLVSRAFGVAEDQIERGPAWLDSEKYDVAAKADTAHEMSRAELRPCLQAMLADRFRLKVHRETKQGPVFSLELAKNGPKFQDHPDPVRPSVSAFSGDGKAGIQGTKATMALLAEYLSAQSGRPVIDNTGLRGEYDFHFEWALDRPAATTGPSLFTAIQEQLGLKLNATRGPIDIIVIDHAEKASAN